MTNGRSFDIFYFKISITLLQGPSRGCSPRSSPAPQRTLQVSQDVPFRVFHSEQGHHEAPGATLV